MKQTIYNDIPQAVPENFPEQILSWMDDFKISHIPYFSDGSYTMLLTESQLFDFKPMFPIGTQIKNTAFCPFCTENQHIFEIFSIMAKNRLTLLPVLSEDKKYLGVLLASELFFDFGLSFSEFNGAIIKLESPSHDYSLTQIAQITESDNIKILQLFTEPLHGSERINITLLLNSTRLQGIIQTFIRYGYTVKEVYGQQNEDDPIGMQDRYDSLMNFLNI